MRKIIILILALIVLTGCNYNIYSFESIISIKDKEYLRGYAEGLSDGYESGKKMFSSRDTITYEDCFDLICPKNGELDRYYILMFSNESIKGFNSDFTRYDDGLMDYNTEFIPIINMDNWMQTGKYSQVVEPEFFEQYFLEDHYFILGWR